MRDERSGGGLRLEGWVLVLIDAIERGFILLLRSGVMGLGLF